MHRPSLCNAFLKSFFLNRRKTPAASTKMSHSKIETAFISIKPLEPVLVASDSAFARHLRDHVHGGRIYSSHPTWVYVPMPEGLLRVRKAKGGDIAFEFEHSQQARAWNGNIDKQGKIFANDHDNPYRDRNVYVGSK